jgi:hypothetical protein
MVQRICPYCRCEDSCGREAFVSRPSPDEEGPSPTDVYDARLEFYGHDRTVPDVDSGDLAQDLVRLGCMNFMLRLVDVEYAQESIREVERGR